MSERIWPCTALCVFLVMCTCVSETGGDVSQVCSCASDANGGCDSNQLCDPDNNCDKENVAYGKPAQISSRYRATEPVNRSGPACTAVNGKTGHVMKFIEEDGTNCVHTLSSDNRPWWRVDLGQNYTVTDLTIYSREQHDKRLAGIWIYVDNAICKKLPDDTNGYGLISTITCDSPLRGQVVMLAKNGTTNSDTKFINFCEVQIWVCRAGRYGRDCSQTCHCHNNATCDNLYGGCSNGCMAGYYGPTCSERCGQCLQPAVCNGSNGYCPAGCAPGYHPPLCKQTCQNRRYGENCREQCGRCQNSAVCDVTNGSCQACEGKFAPPLCKECQDGYFGNGSCQQCGQCADSDVCHKVTGQCQRGCQPGYQPPLCMKACENKTYGENCREQCGRCQNSAACDVFNGSCQACEGNFSLPLCSGVSGDVEDDGAAVSLAGPVAGAVVGGFCLGVISLLTVWLCRRRTERNRFTENQSAKPENPQAPNTEHQTLPQAATPTPTPDDVTLPERGQYASLQDSSDYLSPYSTPVFVYDNTNL